MPSRLRERLAMRQFRREWSNSPRQPTGHWALGTGHSLLDGVASLVDNSLVRQAEGSDGEALAAHHGDSALAARLFGHEATLRASHGGTQRLPESAIHDRALDAARAALGDEAFRAAWRTGEHLAVDQAIADALAFTPSGQAVRPANAAPEHRLTAREVEILALLATGMTNAEIAEHLFISPRTAGTHVARILAKLDVDSRSGAVAFAFKHGIGVRR